MTPAHSEVKDPTDLTRADYLTAARRTIAVIPEEDLPSLAAGVAFKIFLSIFPSALAAAGLYGLVRSPSEVAAGVTKIAQNFPLPATAVGFVVDTLVSLTSDDDKIAGSALVIGLVVGLVSASGAAATLIRALNRTFCIADRRPFLEQRLLGLLITAALLFALLTLLGLVVLGPQLRRLIVPAPLQGTFVSAAFTVGRFLLAIVVLVVLFAFVFWVAPNRERAPWQWVSPGALLGVVGWLLVSGGFTLYTQSLGSYGTTYGAIAGVLVLLLWLQLSMLALLVGAVLNSQLEQIRDERRQGPQPSPAVVSGVDRAAQQALAVPVIPPPVQVAAGARSAPRASASPVAAAVFAALGLVAAFLAGRRSG